MARSPVRPEELIARYGLEPLPFEGGRFRQTWAGPPDTASGHPVGTAIIMLLTSATGDFSALHRLPTDEVWHFYQGDPLDLLLLHPDGTDELRILGDGDGEEFQLVVRAGTWMGARVRDGGEWSLFGTTMAPGFLESDYEGGDPDTLAARYPQQAELIRRLCRV
ncbi:cupin domain-containing protein [Streptomyces flavofungini]|uniref:cupin domain-containing protein n=1 Tax=Streptomyces flavofungini TaxID=68200 RepID=UPI0025B097FE|nr:cupin domain-containing protein [Streptomyces flavofungini]WJV47362.1 cupin domain-containing protein [Streptomyces flavofungini]